MRSGTCVIGGETDSREKYIAPTVLTGVKSVDSVMESEVCPPQGGGKTLTAHLFFSLSSVCLSVSLTHSVCLSVCLSVFLSSSLPLSVCVSLPSFLPLCLFVSLTLSICLSPSPSLSVLSVCLSLSVSVFLSESLFFVCLSRITTTHFHYCPINCYFVKKKTSKLLQCSGPARCYRTGFNHKLLNSTKNYVPWN